MWNDEIEKYVRKWYVNFNPTRSSASRDRWKENKKKLIETIKNLENVVVLNVLVTDRS